MTNTYVWAIASLPTRPEDGHADVVCMVNWICTASDGAHSAQLPGTITVDYTPGDPFTPYANLTLQQVLGWVWSAISKTDIQTYLDDQLGVTVAPLPWS